MSAPLSGERLAEIRASVAAAPHPAPGTWALALRDLLAEVDRLTDGPPDMEFLYLYGACEEPEGCGHGPSGEHCPSVRVYRGDYDLMCRFVSEADRYRAELVATTRELTESRARVAELEAGVEETRPVDEDPIAYELTPAALVADPRPALVKLKAPETVARLRWLLSGGHR